MKLFKSPYRAISDEEAAENAAPAMVLWVFSLLSGSI